MSEYTYTTTHYYDRGVFSGLGGFNVCFRVGTIGDFSAVGDYISFVEYYGRAYYVCTNNTIDVTNLTTLHIRVSLTDNSRGSSFCFAWHFYVSQTIPDHDYVPEDAHYSGITGGNTKSHEIEQIIDVSDITGNWYITFAIAHAGSAKIFEIYGETAGEAGGGEGVTSHKNIAEAYVIGLNKGRAEALELATQAYKDGYKLGTIAHSSGGGDDVDYPADTGTIIIDNAGGEDGDDRGTDPDGNVIDMGADGIWLTFGDGAGQPRKYIHVYLDGTVDEGWYNGVYHSYKNHVKADCYDSVTGLSAELYMLTSNGDHAWYTEYSTVFNGSHTYITRIKVGSNGWVFADATSYSGDYPEPHTAINCYELCYVQYADGYAYLGASTTAPEGVVTT